MNKSKYYLGVAAVALIISTAGVAALVKAATPVEPTTPPVVEKKATCGCQNKAETCGKCGGCQSGGDGSCGCKSR